MVALTEMTAPTAPERRDRADLVRSALVVAVAGGLIHPAQALAGSPVHASATIFVAAFVLTIAVAAMVRWAVAPSVLATVVGSLAILAGCFLLSAATYPGSGFVVAALLGAGIGPFLPAWHALNPGNVVAAIVAGAVIAIVGWWLGSGLAGLVLSFLAIAATAVLLLPHSRLEPSARRSPTLASLTLLYGAFSFFWVGSTSPSVEWFGSLTSHGPRDRNEVALTFDDGPDANFTLPIAAVLEQYGVRGTFFEVGKAIVRNPQITQTLMDRGHIVGNHSYHHGAFSYLDPRYAELGLTEDVFRDRLHTCPALFRPPHGTHTPFMSRVVDNAGMKLVTWDVSAKDWVETDSEALAAHVLKKVKPGSIILLHDSIDGNPGADRSVVVKALPAILEGLKAKGLTPVTLDKLLGVPAYLSKCS